VATEIISATERLAALPSGRSIAVCVADGRESIEIRNPEGLVELEIALTSAGPVLRLRAACLELEASEVVSLRCRRFEVQTTEATELHSEGSFCLSGQEMRVRTRDDIHMDGKFVRLNCDPDFPRPELSQS
jgi:hypothetical protein